MILKLAEAVNMPILISKQPHGARLEEEDDLLSRIMDVNSEIRDIVIVEIPGPATERMLEHQGFAVHIIDHHRYDNLDRMKQQSSLEQFRELFGIDKKRIETLGFDDLLVRGVGAIDRGFLWELEAEGIVGSDKSQAIQFYRDLSQELGGKSQEDIDEAERVWEHRRMENGVLVLESTRGDLSIRNLLSFAMAEAYPEHPPQTVIVQGNRRIYVQESDKAKILHETFGGYTFGRDACWGILASEERSVPGLHEVLSLL